MGCQKQVASLQVRPENYKPCNLAGRACSVTGCRSAHCAMQPREQSSLGHGLSLRTLRHATSPPLRFGSVTGCRPGHCAMQPRLRSASARSRAAPLHCAMQPRRQSLLGHGLSPYKKAKKQIFLRERAPDEICFYLFCMACSFREKKCLHYGKRYGRLIFAVT